MHFHFVTAAGEIGVLPAVPCHLLINEIILLPFDALRENLGAHDQWRKLRFFLGRGGKTLNEPTNKFAHGLPLHQKCDVIYQLG